jgi:hypothetical protein
MCFLIINESLNKDKVLNLTTNHRSPRAKIFANYALKTGMKGVYTIKRRIIYLSIFDFAQTHILFMIDRTKYSIHVDANLRTLAHRLHVFSLMTFRKEVMYKVDLRYQLHEHSYLYQSIATTSLSFSRFTQVWCG